MAIPVEAARQVRLLEAVMVTVPKSVTPKPSEPYGTVKPGVCVAERPAVARMLAATLNETRRDSDNSP